MGLRNTMTDDMWGQWAEDLLVFGRAHAAIVRNYENFLKIGMLHSDIEDAAEFFSKLHSALIDDDKRKLPAFEVFDVPECKNLGVTEVDFEH